MDTALTCASKSALFTRERTAGSSAASKLNAQRKRSAGTSKVWPRLSTIRNEVGRLHAFVSSTSIERSPSTFAIAGRSVRAQRAKRFAVSLVGSDRRQRHDGADLQQ